MTVTVRIVGAGVDTLYASARGMLRDGLLVRIPVESGHGFRWKADRDSD